MSTLSQVLKCRRFLIIRGMRKLSWKKYAVARNGCLMTFVRLSMFRQTWLIWKCLLRSVAANESPLFGQRNSVFTNDNLVTLTSQLTVKDASEMTGDCAVHRQAFSIYRHFKGAHGCPADGWDRSLAPMNGAMQWCIVNSVQKWQFRWRCHTKLKCKRWRASSYGQVARDLDDNASSLHSMGAQPIKYEGDLGVWNCDGKKNLTSKRAWKFLMQSMEH